MELGKLLIYQRDEKRLEANGYSKRKKDEHGNVSKYKARFVSKGFTQKEGVDFNETFAPVVKFTSLRLILALAAQYDLELEQMDFVTAFLNGDLTEEIYVK